jgi:hypothetical protein
VRDKGIGLSDYQEAEYQENRASGIRELVGQAPPYILKN